MSAPLKVMQLRNLYEARRAVLASTVLCDKAKETTINAIDLQIAKLLPAKEIKK